MDTKHEMVRVPGGWNCSCGRGKSDPACPNARPDESGAYDMVRLACGHQVAPADVVGRSPTGGLNRECAMCAECLAWTATVR